MNACRCRPRWKEALMRVEEEDGMGARDGGEQAVQQRRGPGTLRACNEMRVPERQATKEGIERGETCRHDVSGEFKVRCVAEGESDRKRGEEWRGCFWDCYALHHRDRLRLPTHLLPAHQHPRNSTLVLFLSSRWGIHWGNCSNQMEPSCFVPAPLTEASGGI